MQTSAKFCKVFALKFLPFFVQNGSALFVGCASTFIIFRPAKASLKYVFFVHCVIKRIVDHVPTLAVKQEWNNCIVSSIHLSVRFDWRNFALTLAVRISIAEFPFRLDYVGCDTLSDVHQSSMILVISMDAAGEHRYRLTPKIRHLFYVYIFIL